MDCIALAELCESGNLYNRLTDLYQPAYANDYRLIVDYQQDIINHPEYPGEYLTEFAKAIAALDISPFFITIRTSYTHIHRDLQILAKLYNDTAMLAELCEQEFTPVRTSTDTFCIEPWIHLYFNPQGQITPCCIADNQYPLGNYRADAIDFNSDAIVNLRQAMLDGYQVPQCTSCYRTEKNNVASLRQRLNKKYAHHIIKPMPVRVEPFKLRQVDVRLSNLCNLKCRMCSGKFSSKIAQEDFQIWGTTEYLQDANTDEQEQRIFQLVQSQIDNIEHVYFAGGEPLINDVHYDILDMLIKHNRLSTEIVYNTNFSLLKYKYYNVLDYWKQFTNVTVGASIDLIGPAADYVRTGVEYSVLEDNYRRLKEQCPNVRFEIHSTLSLYNAFNLCDLQQHWIDTMHLDPCAIKFNLLVDPEHLELTVLPAEFKQRLTKRIIDHIDYLGAGMLATDWQKVLEVLCSTDKSYLLRKFFELNDAKDQYRKHRFEDYFPEYLTLRNYIV